MNKFYKIFIALLLPLFISAQIKIGGVNGEIASPSVILQFGDITDGTIENPGNKGLLLPTILSDFIIKADRNEGTIFYDLKDGAVKYLSKTQETYIDNNENSDHLMNNTNSFDFKNLTMNSGEPLKHYKVYMNLISGNSDDDLINGRSIFSETDYINSIKSTAEIIENDKSQGVIIGNTTSFADGVLILETSDKGILLPRVYEPHLNIKNPDAGLICYDTAIQMVAFFDGNLWYYWY